MWNTVITDKGVDLIKNTLTGENITVTSIQAGSDKVELENLKSVTDISNKKQTGTIQGITNTEDGLIKINVLFTNIGLTTSYNMTQIGIYAKDKSDNEILFLIAQNDGQEVPADTKNTPWALVHNFYIKLNDDINFTVNINNDGYVTYVDLNDAIKNSKTVQDQKKEIQEEGQRVLATIPKDYQETVNSVSELKEDKVNKPSVSDDGKIPRAKEGEVEWVEVGQPTDEQTMQ